MSPRSLTPPSKRFRPAASKKGRRSAVPSRWPTPAPGWELLGLAGLVIGLVIAYAAFRFHAGYTVSWRSPVQVELHWPWVVSHRMRGEYAADAQADQSGRPLTAYQQYACEKFGPACRVALAIQRAENLKGRCEIYHYNNDGTLDWGYFQINTVHLKRPGLNLRDLLDCKANIDFAYELYREKDGFTPWSTYKSGAYRQYRRSGN